MSSIMKIRPVGAELFQAEKRTNGRTGSTKLIITFRNFVNAAKIVTAQNLTFSFCLLRALD